MKVPLSCSYFKYDYNSMTMIEYTSSMSTRASTRLSAGTGTQYIATLVLNMCINLWYKYNSMSTRSKYKLLVRTHLKSAW